MTTLPKVATKTSAKVELEEGTTYSFCTCGLSEKQPFCDGSHKGTDFRSLKFTAEKTGTVFLCQCKQSANLPFCDGSHSKI